MLFHFILFGQQFLLIFLNNFLEAVASAFGAGFVAEFGPAVRDRRAGQDIVDLSDCLIVGFSCLSGYFLGRAVLNDAA